MTTTFRLSWASAINGRANGSMSMKMSLFMAYAKIAS